MVHALESKISWVSPCVRLADEASVTARTCTASACWRPRTCGTFSADKAAATPEHGYGFVFILTSRVRESHHTDRGCHYGLPPFLKESLKIFAWVKCPLRLSGSWWPLCSPGITFDVPGADRDCQAYFLWKKREEDTETSGGGAEGEGVGLWHILVDSDIRWHLDCFVLCDSFGKIHFWIYNYL